MDIKLLDEDKVITVPYLEFLNSKNNEKVIIKNQKAEQVVESRGLFVAQNPDPAEISGKRKDFASREVEDEVISWVNSVSIILVYSVLE